MEIVKTESGTPYKKLLSLSLHVEAKSHLQK